MTENDFRDAPPFAAGERGAITVEIVMWFAALVAAGQLVGQQIVGPLVEVAEIQHTLNQQSVAAILAAQEKCPEPQPAPSE
jgi:hypothetical protein